MKRTEINCLNCEEKLEPHEGTICDACIYKGLNEERKKNGRRLKKKD